MVIENNINDNSNEKRRIGNDVDLSIYYKYLKGLPIDEVLRIFETVGVAIDCKHCGYIYVDKGKRTVDTYDFSICPRCKGFIALPVKTNDDNIDDDDDDDNLRRRKKHAVIMERECNAVQQAVAFLLRSDFPDEMLVNIILSDDGNCNSNGSNKVYTFLNRKDAMCFLYEKWRRMKEEGFKGKVTVTLY
jgi:hypothetical protein